MPPRIRNPLNCPHVFTQGPNAGSSCGKPTAHPGPHRSKASLEKLRAQNSAYAKARRKDPQRLMAERENSKQWRETNREYNLNRVKAYRKQQNTQSVDAPCWKLCKAENCLNLFFWAYLPGTAGKKYCSKRCASWKLPKEQKNIYGWGPAPAWYPCSEKDCTDFAFRYPRGRAHHSRRCTECRYRAKRKNTTRWSNSHREYMRAKEKAWRLANADYKVMTSARRRAQVRGQTTVRFSREQLAARLTMFPGCWMCGGTYECIDHVKPITKGGPHMLSNLRPACRSCNQKKGGRWYGVGKLSVFTTRVPLRQSGLVLPA